MLNALIGSKRCSWAPHKQHDIGNRGEVMSLVIPNWDPKIWA
jgi:hypothetical protein